jgi:glycosyltransferase involved in cell wall biosynthesis
MKICAVVPAFNEGENVGGLVRKLLSYVKEVIVVDDGSADDTFKEAQDAGATVLRHLRNCGKGAALRTGFNHALKAGYDGVITLDADGQHDYREVPLFINEVEKCGADIVLGTRMGSVRGMPLIRLLTNIVTSLIVSILSRQRITDSQTGFRLIKREVLEKARLTTTNYETESEILIKASRKGFKITEIPIKTIYRNQASNINAFIDTLRFIRLVLKMGLWI